MRRIAFFLSLIVLLNGCSGSFQQRWNNFRAYYNTYYNAKTEFRIGVNAVEKTKIQINPARPIRVHTTPIKIGAQSFEKVVEKGATVLREHASSKWVDDAGLIIGKSYFYLTQFFAAEQKFDEILLTSTDKSVRQEAIFWKGRTMLEMKRYAEGRGFLQTQLNSIDYDWDRELSARIHIIIAEIYVEEQNFDQAKIELAQFVPSMPDSPEKARAAFLMGQLYEFDKEFDKARAAYEMVVEEKPPYELLFLAQSKFAAIAREAGELGTAMRIYRKMLKDDKNFDIISEIQYEVGKTLQSMGDYIQASEFYKTVLYKSIKQPTKETKAQVYYALGEISRDFLRDYTLAAAYFDSSAKQNPDLTKLPESYDAKELADAFGAYSGFAQTVAKNDSLMYLASLSKSELDSTLKVIYAQKAEELKEEAKRRQEEQNTYATAPGAQANDDQQSQSIVGEYGFLNYKNPTLVADARRDFSALWGNRPLIDHWRRSKYVQSQGDIFDESKKAADSTQTESGTDSISELIDLKEIPFSDEQKAELMNKSANAKYQIGNLFYLTLKNLDSARNRYRQVIYQHEDAEVRPRALFTLSELERAEGNELRAKQFATNLVDDYPQSYLSKIIAERNGLEIPLTNELRSYRDSVLVVYDSLQAVNLEPIQRAHQLKAYADSCKEEDLAIRAYWTSTQLYVENAKDGETYDSVYNYLLQSKNEFAEQQIALADLKVEARSMMQDSSLSTADSLRWMSVLDSTLTEPEWSKMSPYKGASWDSARVVLGILAKRFPQSSITKMSKPLLAEISIKEEKPAVKEEKKSTSTQTIEIAQDVFVQLFPDSLHTKQLRFEVKLDSSGKVSDLRDPEEKLSRYYLGIQAHLNTFHKIKKAETDWTTIILKMAAKKEE